MEKIDVLLISRVQHREAGGSVCSDWSQRPRKKRLIKANLATTVLIQFGGRSPLRSPTV